MASTTILESPATFESQAERASLSNPYILALKAHGISTLSKLAYAVTTPGVSPSDAQVTQFLQTIRPGVDPTISDSTAVKRLILESQTLTIANLRATLQSSDDSGAKRIAPPERSARIAAQKVRLSGMDLSGPLEPSFWLYDTFSNMLDSGELKYVAPNRCLTRQLELTGAKPEKQVKLDDMKSGLVIRDAQPEHTIPLSTDLSLYQAMTRRALAMDLVGLATYSTIMKWNSRMFNMMSQSVAPGFTAPGQTQLLRADRQSFLRLAEMVTTGFKADGIGNLPLDAAFEQLHTDVTVTYHLLPCPQQSGPTKNDANADRIRDSPYGKGGDGHKGKGKGKKGKGKGKKQRFRSSWACTTRHHKAKPFALTITLASATHRLVPGPMCAANRTAISSTLNSNANEMETAIENERDAWMKCLTAMVKRMNLTALSFLATMVWNRVQSCWITCPLGTIGIKMSAIALSCFVVRQALQQFAGKCFPLPLVWIIK